jgi:hypothetical protein
MKNVNKRSRRTSKHVELWAKNAFDKWKMFCGFDIEKCITNMLES